MDFLKEFLYTVNLYSMKEYMNQKAVYKTEDCIHNNYIE